jgi:hypothetical protein
MYVNVNLFMLAVLAGTGAVLLLYIMRRRVRQGRRKPKF